MRRTFRIASILLLLALSTATLTVWIFSYYAPWSLEIRRDHRDFRLLVSSSRGIFSAGETHHFEVWRFGYWQPFLLFVLPLAIWFRRWYVARRAMSRVGRCAACGYDLRATPDRCPECGAIRTA